MIEKVNLHTEFVETFNLQEDDVVFVSSDLSNLAKYFKENEAAFDVNTFIETLQLKVKKGTLIFPAYTDNLRNGDVFDYQKTKPTTGALSNRIGRRKDFVRSFDPLHSVYTWGKKADEIVKLKEESSFGENSIFGLLARENAKFVFIDVDLQNSFTFIHYLEEKLKISYRKYYSMNIQLNNGHTLKDKTILFHTKKMGVCTQLYPLQDYLIRKGFLEEKLNLNANVHLSNANEMTKGVHAFLSSGGKMYTFDFKLFAKQFVKRILGKRYY